MRKLISLYLIRHNCKTYNDVKLQKKIQKTMPNSNGNVYNVYANYRPIRMFLPVLLCCYCQIAANTTNI